MSFMAQEQVEQILKNELPLIRQCIRMGWDRYMKDYPIALRTEHSSRSRASLVHDHIVMFARQILEPRQGICCHEINKLFIVSFDCGIAIRFKKLDECFRASNIRTQQSMDFMEQEDLPEIQAAVKLQAGYRLNMLETDLEGIYVTCPASRQANSWVLELAEEQYGINNVSHIRGVEAASAKKPKGVRFTKRGGENANEEGQS
jgi:hypothetical protein